MPLIGISGYIGSGKDTVGKMIQYLTAVPRGPKAFNPNVNYSIDSPWKVVKFAAKLKHIASVLTGIPVEKFEDQEFKKTFLGPEWDYWEYEGKRYPSWEDAMMVIANKQGTSFDEVDKTTVSGHRMNVRQFLQELGTEGIRNGVHPQAWINATFAEYVPLPWDGRSFGYDPRSPKYPNWTLTDMRFPNEMKAIKDREGITIRVNRMKSAEMIAGPGGTHLHSSEVALDGAEFDYYLSNSGSLEHLLGQVREIV